MSGRTMEQRVGDLEKLAQTLAPMPGQMAQLGDRVADVESRLGSVESRLGLVQSQIVQLRTDMSDGFSATKEELREDIAALGREMAAQFVRAGNQTRMLHEDLVERMPPSTSTSAPSASPSKRPFDVCCARNCLVI